MPRTEAILCDVIVSHADSGTTVAGLARGLPMVAIPIFADQMHNAERVVAAGIGLRVDPDWVPDDLTSISGHPSCPVSMTEDTTVTDMSATEGAP